MPLNLEFWGGLPTEACPPMLTLPGDRERVTAPGAVDEAALPTTRSCEPVLLARPSSVSDVDWAPFVAEGGGIPGSGGAASVSE